MARGMARNMASTMSGTMSRARGSAEARVRVRAGTKAKLLREAGGCTMPGGVPQDGDQFGASIHNNNNLTFKGHLRSLRA